MILMKDIIREGHKTLTTVAKEVVLPLSGTDKKTLVDLLEYVKNSQDPEMVEKYGLRPGVGLAAPQINVSKRMFAVHAPDLDNNLYSFAFVNPVITPVGNNIIYLPGGEGCLSVDRITEGLTPRYETIKVEGLAYDQEHDRLSSVSFTVSGYIAIVFQHEYDHLNGILYVSKLFDHLPNAKPAFEYEIAEEETNE